MKRTENRQAICNELVKLLKLTRTGSDIESLEFENPGMVVARFKEGGESLIDTWGCSDADFITTIIEAVA